MSARNYVIIPAYNEADSVGLVINEIPKSEVEAIIVVDNNSTDKTAEVAKAAGAIVLSEKRQGYGSACLKGIAYLNNLPASEKPAIVIFMDADHSDYPEELTRLTQPIQSGKADMVIGSRALGKQEIGAMLPQQKFGNWLAVFLIKIIYGVKYTDLGPFRAIRYDALQKLEMADPDYGWTVEMQIKAIQKKLNFTEVPVKYRKRIGTSKVSGTVKGTIMAGYKIILLIFKYALK